MTNFNKITLLTIINIFSKIQLNSGQWWIMVENCYIVPTGLFDLTTLFFHYGSYGSHFSIGKRSYFDFPPLPLLEVMSK